MSKLKKVVDVKDMGSRYGAHHPQETGTYMEARAPKKKKKNSSEKDERRPRRGIE